MVNTSETLSQPEFDGLSIVKKKRKIWKVVADDMKKNWKLHLVILPVLVFFLVFSYFPMIGILTSFMDYRPTRGFFDSEWVGFKYFNQLFTDAEFWQVFRNTVVMALLNLSIGFIVPIIFALLLSEIKIKALNRPIQIASYLPYFVATVVVCSIVTTFVANNGVVTKMFMAFGMEQQDMLNNPNYFWGINTVVNIWQGMGYGAIVFTAAIQNVNNDLNEAAALDGANRWQRMWHITLPSILPMIVTMFILKVGLMFSTGFDNILLLYRPSTYDTADVISTYVYRKSIGGGGQYGYSAAVGLFQSILATVLLVASNKISAKLAKTALF
ncbi:MAG: sugar ABC transporter permease [Eubacterium sp.]|nr:sugar ABC transporter permease [Eubacterium sp.]